MRRMMLLSVFLAVACRDKATAPGEDTGTVLTGEVDADSDGYTADEDCDDNSSLVNPDAEEVCDGVDNNCDGVVDEGVTSTFYADADADGFGNASAPTEACSEPTGFVGTANDCDDSDADSYPGASERCDGADNDCDGEADEDVLGVWYADADSDGYGAAGSAYEVCDPPPGYVDNADDCDDTNAEALPGGAEVCDEADNDCDGTVDEEVTTTFYQDADDDSFGLADVTTEACVRPTGYAAEPGDCDDSNRSVSPAAAELCDSVDNDCDGTTDEDDAADAATWHADADSDGYGDAAAATVACDAPSGHVSDDTDCDDTDSSISPAAAEVCNGADDDCNGWADDDDPGVSGGSRWYLDRDSDGYGDASVATVACDAPSGYVSDDTDCDDTNADALPGGVEVCDEVDNDCDGSTDEGVTATFYFDYDSDGYGDSGRTTDACAAPSGYVSDDTDCDDTDSAINPSAQEVCDEVDNDCDADIDDDDASVDLSAGGTFYADTDADGYGDPDSAAEGCGAPSGYVDDDTDCDDGDDRTNPAASELCDGADNNCDGVDDDGVLGDGEACPALHCQEVLDDDAGAPDGSYWIQPDSGLDPFEAWCDMSTDDGGWTLLVTLDTTAGTFQYLSDWADEPDVTGGAPASSGMYKGSLAEFSEVREEIASGAVVAYGSSLSEAELEQIRDSYGYGSRMSAAAYFADMPDCSLSYGGATIAGCSRYAATASYANTSTVIGWSVDPTSTYYTHCWFARGNCCSGTGGSSLCNGNPNGTTWARTWFR